MSKKTVRMQRTADQTITKLKRLLANRKRAAEGYKEEAEVLAEQLRVCLIYIRAMIDEQARVIIPVAALERAKDSYLQMMAKQDEEGNILIDVSGLLGGAQTGDKAEYVKSLDEEEKTPENGTQEGTS